MITSHLCLGVPSALPSGLPTKTLYALLISHIHAKCPSFPILLYFIIQTIFGEQYRSLNSLVCSLLHTPFTSSHLGPNIILNILFSNTHSLCSSCSVSDQVSHPYKTTAKLEFCLNILIFIFLDSKLEEKRFRMK